MNNSTIYDATAERPDCAYPRPCIVMMGHNRQYAEFCEMVYQSRDENITLSDIALIARLASEDTSANYAANIVYHHQTKHNRDTTGHVGF